MKRHPALIILLHPGNRRTQQSRTQERRQERQESSTQGAPPHGSKTHTETRLHCGSPRVNRLSSTAHCAGRKRRQAPSDHLSSCGSQSSPLAKKRSEVEQRREKAQKAEEMKPRRKSLRPCNKDTCSSSYERLRQWKLQSLQLKRSERKERKNHKHQMSCSSEGNIEKEKISRVKWKKVEEQEEIKKTPRPTK